MPRRPPPEPEGALYVRLPAKAVDKLDRAAEALGVRKKDLVAGLVTRYVDPDSRKGLSALGALSQPRRGMVELGQDGPTLGSYSFQAYDAPERAPERTPERALEFPEILTAEQAGQFLQLDDKDVLELAETGQLPGRKLGKVWRFSRAALVTWMSAPISK
ncbi:MAG: helix-turn-helix domain-containing protein [Myxococcales bacterium]|nr:helix-turn-helix domain-containing protein [Myxococcales bacterium]